MDFQASGETVGDRFFRQARLDAPPAGWQDPVVATLTHALDTMGPRQFANAVAHFQQAADPAASMFGGEVVPRAQALKEAFGKKLEGVPDVKDTGKFLSPKPIETGGDRPEEAARELRALRPIRGSSQAREAARVFLNVPLTNLDTRLTATVSGETLGKMLSASAARRSISIPAHMQAVANLDTLFRHALHREARGPRPGDVGIDAFQHFDVPMLFDGDLDVTAHEVAHLLDDRYGIVGAWAAPRTRSPYDAELIPNFSGYGSVRQSGPRATLRYQRAEGVAEWVRAWILNPQAAEAAAPQFAAFFKGRLPAEEMRALQTFSDDVRRWAGQEPSRRMKKPRVEHDVRPAARKEVRVIPSPQLADRLAGARQQQHRRPAQHRRRQRGRRLGLQRILITPHAKGLRLGGNRFIPA